MVGLSAPVAELLGSAASSRSARRLGRSRASGSPGASAMVARTLAAARAWAYWTSWPHRAHPVSLGLCSARRCRSVPRPGPPAR